MQVDDTLPQVFFKHFPSKNQLSGLSISGTLVENELNISGINWLQKKFHDLFFYDVLNFLGKDIEKIIFLTFLIWNILNRKFKGNICVMVSLFVRLKAFVY